MDGKTNTHPNLHYQPQQWQNDDSFLPGSDFNVNTPRIWMTPDVWDRSRLLELLGQINYKVLTGNRVYIEIEGVVYRTLYGGYWRSVFTGVEHYLLRCRQVSKIWLDGSTTVFDLPIIFSRGNWSARGHSISLMVYRD